MGIKENSETNSNENFINISKRISKSTRQITASFANMTDMLNKMANNKNPGGVNPNT